MFVKLRKRKREAVTGERSKITRNSRHRGRKTREKERGTGIRSEERERKDMRGEERISTIPRHPLPPGKGYHFSSTLLQFQTLKQGNLFWGG